MWTILKSHRQVLVVLTEFVSRIHSLLVFSWDWLIKVMVLDQIHLKSHAAIPATVKGRELASFILPACHYITTLHHSCVEIAVLCTLVL